MLVVKPRPCPRRSGGSLTRSSAAKEEIDLANETPVNVTVQFTMVVALAALDQTLLALAAFHGNQPGPWLDELQNRFETDVKNSVGEGLSIETEKLMVDGALVCLRMIMNGVRKHTVRAASWKQ
jgi:hypothetical protein